MNDCRYITAPLLLGVEVPVGGQSKEKIERFSHLIGIIIIILLIWEFFTPAFADGFIFF